VSCIKELFGPNTECKRMLDDKTRMLAHNATKTEDKAVPIIHQAANEDPALCIEARTQIAAAVYAITEAIERFDTWVGNILYFASGQENGRQTRRVTGETGCTRSERHYVFLLTYGFPLGLRLGLSVGDMIFP